MPEKGGKEAVMADETTNPTQPQGTTTCPVEVNPISEAASLAAIGGKE